MDESNNDQETSKENTEASDIETSSSEQESEQDVKKTEETCHLQIVSKKEETSTDKNDTEKSKDDTTENSLNESLKDTFKKPVLIIGPRKGLPTKVKTLVQGTIPDVFVSPEQPTSNNEKNNLLNLIKKPEKIETLVDTQKEKLSLPYLEPSWSGIPEAIYKLEVLKSGTILETIDLSNKSFYVVGRLPSCDISMAHPTISRYHAIFQYRTTADDKNGKGFYVYDLGSTHGTFWNGNRIRPKMYVRLQGGHMIRFGCSQRKFIVLAPSDDQEEESEFSVTELKEMRRLELEERERLEKQRLLELEEQERLRKEKEETEGIDWGMSEDADEETDLTENPYAQTNNEELFLDDPKKTLRGWFEREGHELQYQTEDKGIGKFLCWVDLPIDTSTGRTVRAEALVSGKKKEAVIQCALEACRVLDRYGLLRQANHEAKKRKARNWEEEDFYDSDEDNFLDRTGTIEKKREQRMRLAGKLDTKAETYDSLLEKHSKVATKIVNFESTIALHKMKQNEMKASNEDALDAFMSTLDSATLDKTEIRKMKMELVNLRKEEAQLLKLINIAKPANLPPLKPQESNVHKKSINDYKDLKFIGHKKKIKLSKKSETASSKSEEDDSISKNEYKEDSIQVCKNTEKQNKNLVEVETNDNQTNVNVDLINENSAVTTNNDIDEDNCELENVKKKKKNMKRNQQRMDKVTKEMKKSYDEEEFREDYSMWLPPENQSGDGKTSLNEKFGY